VVATHGRSFWVLDDVTPLREVGAARSAGSVHLYKPETAYRLYYPDQVDARPPVGQNPPPGALIDYYLSVTPQGPVTIDILDANGAVVRHLTSVKPEQAEQPPEWPDQVHAMKTLPAAAGMNRFVWDLRYDDPVQIPGAFYAGLPPRGPIVLPGEYTVRLTYAGQSQTAPLALKFDPRVTGPTTGAQQKFALAMQVYHDQDALHRAVNDIRRFKGELSTALKSSGGGGAGAGLATEGNALAQQASQIEGVLMQVNIKGSEANLNYPGMLNEQIYSFADLLSDADTAPNQPELDTYAMLHSRLQTQLGAWEDLKKTGIPGLCAKLRSAGGPASPMSSCAAQ
jgi:hypothetical protein